MKFVSAEKLIEKLECDVYPITLVKFLLNRRRILSFFSKAINEEAMTRNLTFKLDTTNCESCKTKNIICRQHTSISRVLNCESAIVDIENNIYFYKNEIFKMVGKKLVIVYCPHPKLIKGQLTDEKVRKVMPLTVSDETLNFSPEKIKTIKSFLVTDLMEQSIKCWFNDEFSIITLPEDKSLSNWCLISNK